jgi:hypothetical protein
MLHRSHSVDPALSRNSWTPSTSRPSRRFFSRTSDTCSYGTCEYSVPAVRNSTPRRTARSNSCGVVEARQHEAAEVADVGVVRRDDLRAGVTQLLVALDRQGQPRTRLAVSASCGRQRPSRRAAPMRATSRRPARGCCSTPSWSMTGPWKLGSSNAAKKSSSRQTEMLVMSSGAGTLGSSAFASLRYCGQSFTRLNQKTSAVRPRKARPRSPSGGRRPALLRGPARWWRSSWAQDR